MIATEKINDISKESYPIKFLQSINPVTQECLAEKFAVATSKEMEEVVEEAFHAWQSFKKTSGKERATLLRAIAAEIENLGATLIEKVIEESGLPEGRIIGERGRTLNQLRQFADLVEEGHWVAANIQQSDNGTGIRKMLTPLGPVAVFTASNFPLAFSTAGGDTASALAAGCSVIVKAHSSHLGTNALIAKAITKAIEKCKLPKGIFASLNGGIAVGQKLVQHPLLKAVGFTGSNKGGKALFDLANNRPEPIPVFAEMGSNNPIFVLPERVKNNPLETATQIANSVNLGAGQFCTNPGLIIIHKNESTSQFLQALTNAFSQLQPATMLNKSIYQGFEKAKANCLNVKGVISNFQLRQNNADWKGYQGFATVSAMDFLQQEELQEEIFGPFTLVILCDKPAEMLSIAKNIAGQLTATILGETEELQNAATLAEYLSQKAGRVIFNEVPTGVAVCPAMHHGGPYPATSSSFHTSVGTDAIKRFVRPVAFQNTPDFLLPDALKLENPLNIWRTVDGQKVKA